MPALKLQRIELQQNTDELHAQLRAELNVCTDVQASYRNKIEKFMAAEEIWHIADLDYPTRERYEKFLAGEVKPVSYAIYLKAFDRIKRLAINSQMKIMAKGQIVSPHYRNAVLFLPYYQSRDCQTIRKFHKEKGLGVGLFQSCSREHEAADFYGTGL